MDGLITLIIVFVVFWSFMKKVQQVMQEMRERYSKLDEGDAPPTGREMEVQRELQRRIEELERQRKADVSAQRRAAGQSSLDAPAAARPGPVVVAAPPRRLKPVDAGEPRPMAPAAPAARRAISVMPVMEEPPRAEAPVPVEPARQPRPAAPRPAPRRPAGRPGRAVAQLRFSPSMMRRVVVLNEIFQPPVALRDNPPWGRR
ncbi:MAG TPA: hypothetical protein PLS90_08500 [Candidatus Sumerlaeota bacterium]|nr:hypothetical protein [Candidatus Sumerlaeota bacterium]